MEDQASNQNNPPEDADQELKIIKEKVRAIPLRYHELPTYIQNLMKARAALKTEYLSTKQEGKRIEYVCIFEAVEKELRFHQYRIYRRDHPTMVFGPDEKKLQAHLYDYIRKLIKKNIKNRLCYITSREPFYKTGYDGIKNAVKKLIDVLDFRWGCDILEGLDNRTLKLTFNK